MAANLIDHHYATEGTSNCIDWFDVCEKSDQVMGASRVRLVYWRYIIRRFRCRAGTLCVPVNYVGGYTQIVEVVQY